MMDARTKVRANTETTQCPFCCETLMPESSECQSCGSDLAFFCPAPLGWSTIAVYAAATSKSEEAVLSAIRDGDLDGKLICGKWLVRNEECG